MCYHCLILSMLSPPAERLHLWFARWQGHSFTVFGWKWQMPAAFFYCFVLLDMRVAVLNIPYASAWQWKHAYLIPHPSNATPAEADSCCKPLHFCCLSLNCISLTTPPSGAATSFSVRLPLKFLHAFFFFAREHQRRVCPTAMWSSNSEM